MRMMQVNNGPTGNAKKEKRYENTQGVINMETQKILQKIVEERQRQIAKWGDQQHHDTIWYLILQEELGEIAKEVLENDEDGTRFYSLSNELIQAAAVIVAWVEDMTRHKEL